LEVLDLPKTQTAVNSTVKKEELLEKKLVWKDLYLFWNGAIEGRIQGLSGGPAKPWLDIGRADGAIAAEPSPNSWTDDRGTFSFTLLPPGRYTLRINEDGPSDESPYAPQYYPSSPSLGGAHIFEVAEGQQIRNVDLVLRRLYKRNLNIRVTWPDGRPVDKSEVNIAYEHTDLYDTGGRWASSTDHNGIATATAFSASHIRVWAKSWLMRAAESLRCTTVPGLSSKPTNCRPVWTWLCCRQSVPIPDGEGEG